MKRAISLICILAIVLSVFVVPSFAVSSFPLVPAFSSAPNLSTMRSDGLKVDFLQSSAPNRSYYFAVKDNEVYCFLANRSMIVFVPVDSSINPQIYWTNDSNYNNILTRNGELSDYQGVKYFSLSLPYDVVQDGDIPYYAQYTVGLLDCKDFIDNRPSPITKNAHVDEFLANTLISMGFTFDSASKALAAGSAVWDWCIDEENASAGFQSWDVEYFAHYCNAQSNNYADWYQGYKVSKDVVNGIAQYIYTNRSLDGSITGIDYYSVDTDYYPQITYGSGFNQNQTSATSYTFYPASTITYVNGDFITSSGIDSQQFLYTPPDVRSFIGSASPLLPGAPSDPHGTGTITDQNGDKVYDIDINFPSLEWLGQALQAIADAIKSLLDTVSTLLSKLIDAVQALLGDAFESLSTFGEGIIEWIRTVWTALQGLLNSYFPSDITSILVAFICLNIGIGLIKFILRCL